MPNPITDGIEYEYTPNNDLFWALRGGGAGPWGAVTSMTMKLHKPKCSEKCYFVQNVAWQGKFDDDDGKMAVDILSRSLCQFLLRLSLSLAEYKGTKRKWYYGSNV